MIKKYVSTGVTYTFPVKLKGKVKYVSISNRLHYISKSEEEQAEIESSKCFKSGGIKIYSVEGENKTTSSSEKGIDNSIVIEKATTAQEAKEILRSEYNVPHQSLTTPEKIRAKAEELSISFPNVAW